MTYELTEELRKKLKKPLGNISKEVEYKKLGNPLITVGDVTSYNSLKKGITPDLMIYDFKKQREPVEKEMKEKISKSKPEKIEVKNPAGQITDKAEKEIRKAIKARDPKKIKVNGEEDLLTLICIKEAPIGATITYGQPNKGTVIINVGKPQKNQAKIILQKMEEKNADNKEKRKQKRST